MKAFSYLLSEDSQPIPAPPISDLVYKRTLLADTAVEVVIPTGAHMVSFTTTGVFFVRDGSSITLPTANDNDAPECNPVARQVTAGDSISLRSEAGCVVFMSFYK